MKQKPTSRYSKWSQVRNDLLWKKLYSCLFRSPGVSRSKGTVNTAMCIVVSQGTENVFSQDVFEDPQDIRGTPLCPIVEVSTFLRRVECENSPYYPKAVRGQNHVEDQPTAMEHKYTFIISGTRGASVLYWRLVGKRSVCMCVCACAFVQVCCCHTVLFPPNNRAYLL